MANFPKWSYVTTRGVEGTQSASSMRQHSHMMRNKYGWNADPESGTLHFRHGINDSQDLKVRVGNPSDASFLAQQRLSEHANILERKVSNREWMMTYGHQYPGGRPNMPAPRVADDGPVALGSRNLYKHFRGITQAELNSGRFTAPITFLDIETGHNYTPISTAALKGVIDRRTGEFRVLDVMERYYVPQNTQTASFNISKETHRITPEKARAWRALQGAIYSEIYDQGEQQRLVDFLRGSTIAGHNIEDFDLDKLGLRTIAQDFNVIDTLAIAENLGIRRGQRGLAPMFKKFTGRSLKKAGYSHHIGFHDVMSNAELFSKLYTLGDKAGRDIRYVVNHKGVSYATYEPTVGTSIVRGGFYNAKGHGGVQKYMYEEDFDEGAVFEWKYDENGRRILPEGYSEEVDDDVEIPLDVGSTDWASAKINNQIASAYQALAEELQRVREYSIGFNFSQENQLHARLANMPDDLARKYARNRGYKGKKLDKLMKDVKIIRYSKERRRAAQENRTAARQEKQVQDYLDHLYRSGDLGKGDYEWLSQVNYVKDSGFSPTAVKYMAQEKASERADRMREAHSRNVDEQRKERYLDRMERKHLITKGDRTNLEQLTGSYEDLVDATDDVIEKNKQLLGVYQKFAEIKPYDVNQYLNSAKNQWGGTMKAAQGVLPQFLLNPIGRLGEAAFNYQEGKLAPWNAFTRTWNETAGQIGGAALHYGIKTMNPWAIGIGAVTGTVGAVSQIYGNYKQQQMETKMLGIQNTLNTLGLITSWITTPFKLLQRAAKLLTGSFAGLTLSINKFMQNGIGEMSQMGNPLTELTGINYAAYEGTTMMDIASLFNRGSMNSVYEDFANQQKAFYTMGQVNQNRLIASSLLGIYSDVYNPSTDTKGTYNAMVNKLLASMQGQTTEQKQRTMYLAAQIDSNLPGLLRTANMLGVTDINTLTDPGRRGMYWRPLSDSQETAYRWTQYEYGAAQQQWGRSKMKIANIVWQAVGKDFYNGVNGVVDRMASNDWKGALDEVANWWDTFKGKVTKAWDSIKASLNGKDGDESSVGSWSHSFKLLGLQIVKIALDVSQTILNIWNSIMIQLADKAEGLIAYLSTLSLTPHMKDGKIWFEMNHIGTAEAKHGLVYETDYWNSGTIKKQGAAAGMAGYAALADIIYGPDASYKKATLTDEQLYWDAARYLAEGNAIDLSEYGYNIPGGMVQHAEDLRALFTALGKAGLKGPGFWKVAAQTTAADVPSGWKVANYDDQVGFAAGMADLIAAGNDPVSTSLSIIRDAVDTKIQIELKFLDGQGRTKATMLLDKVQGGVAKAVTKLQDLLPNLKDGYKLEAVKTSE